MTIRRCVAYRNDLRGTLIYYLITVRDTPPDGRAPTLQISLTYLERRQCYGLDKKILLKKQLFDLEVIDQGPTKVITVRDTPPYGHAPLKVK
jgi:hypothetical protein